MRTFFHDLRIALRLFRQSPGLSTAAIVTLALGIGANTTIYSFADAVLFRPLDVPNADRIVHVYARRDQPGTFPMSLAEYQAYLGRTASFEALAAHYPTAPLHALIAGSPEALTGAVTTASYFDVVQVQPALGRFYTAEEDRVRDRDAVAVISHRFWQRRYGGEASVLGVPVTLNGRVFTIIGVAPVRFSGVQARGASVDVWMPSSMFTVGYRYCDAFAPTCTIVHLLGRLRRGVPVDQAQQELDQLSAQVLAEMPDDAKRLGVTVVPARGLGLNAESSERRQLNVFLGSATLVLVITCANIAGLLLARATARRKHLAVRLAIGASRARVVSHVLAESLVLAVLGGLAGLLAATWAADALAAMYSVDSAGRALLFDLSLSLPVIAASFGVALLAAILAGAAPAWHASRTDVISVLKDEGASGGGRRAYLRHALVSAQVAVSVVLLVGSALLIGSARRALQGPGFDPDHVITVRLRPSLVAYSRERSHQFQRAVIDRLESLPGVVSASPSVFMSVFSAGTFADVTVAGRRSETIQALANAVGPRYFSTLGVALRDGREFAEHDRTGAPPVVVVNEVLASQLSSDGAVTGTTIFIGSEPHTIIGVVPDVQYYANGEAPRPQLFTSYWQITGGDAFQNDSRTFVRVSGAPAGMIGDVRRAIAAVDAAVPITEDHPLGARVAYMFQPVRMARALLTAFAILAVVLCAIGLYGVLAFSVTERTREIGVRVAVGASEAQIASLVLREAMVVIAAGVAAGLVTAWYATQFVGSLLYGIDPREPAAFVLALMAIVGAGILVSYLPARRAIRISPLTALRTD
ncbi:MAG TPA: ABC transporter permease [Vicinamibacterales bacterium]|nr:ABC transporter permease [Vicinamibacterales bacterium]